MTPTTASTLDAQAARTRAALPDGDHSAADAPPLPVVGIVLAGTYHSADNAFSGSVPRPLLPVAQIPVIGYVLRWLRDGGVARATICSNSRSRAIERCVGDGASLSMELDYVEDESPRGPAGCARDAALRFPVQTFVVVDGSVIPDCPLQTVIEAHRESGAAVTAVVHYAARSGMNADRVATPAGIYVFDRRAFEMVAAVGFQDIKDHLLPALRRRRQRISAFSSPQFCPRVLNAETYLAVNQWVIERIPADPAMFERWGPFSVTGEIAAHASATVDPSARIIGPAIIGAGVTIGANAVIVGPASIGPNTVIGEGALVSRSVMWNGCTVGDGAFVDASVVGDGVAIAANAAVQGEVKMNRLKSHAPRWRLVPDVPPLRPAPAPAGSVADLAFP